jgi:3-oxoadipate enol-lactonase
MRLKLHGRKVCNGGVMAFTQVNGIDLYFERKGEGQPLLFISGSGADLRNKPNQFDALVGESFDLICYDQRGLGRTEKPKGHYTMAEYADDAAGLLDHLEIDSIAVMGVSFGGMVAQEFACRHPSRVTHMVLACTSSGGVGNPSYPLHELELLAEEERAKQHLQISDTRRNDAWQRENPERWRQLMEISMAARAGQGDRTGAMQQLDARRYHDTFSRLAGLHMPILLAGGKYDGIAPTANMQALNDQLPNSELRFYEGGHLFLIQDKHAYPEIVSWLDALC